MINNIRERDFWSLCELYSVLAAFADDPTNVVSRMGGGRICIPEDQANHLHNFRTTILEKYPDVAG